MRKVKFFELWKGIGCIAPILAFAYFVTFFPGEVMFWALICLPAPPASAWYSVKVHNDTGTEVYVELVNISDTQMLIRDRSERARDELSGWRRIDEAVLENGKTSALRLPGECEPLVAILILSVRAGASSDHGGVSDRVAMFLLPGAAILTKSPKVVSLGVPTLSVSDADLTTVYCDESLTPVALPPLLSAEGRLDYEIAVAP